MIMIGLFSAGFVFVITFIAFKLIRKKTNPLKNIAFWIIWIITTVITYFIIVAIIVFIVFHTPSRKFTTEEWLKNETKKVELIDDLIASGELNGKTKQQVIELLGDPITGGILYFADSGAGMIYSLGLARGQLGLDTEYLLIWFKNDIVEKYEVRVSPD